MKNMNNNNTTATSTFTLVEHHINPMSGKVHLRNLLEGTHEACTARAADEAKWARVLGEDNRFEVVPSAEARVAIEANRAIRDHELAVFRHKVYGEPMPA